MGMETAHTFLIAGLAIFLAWYTLKDEIAGTIPDSTVPEPYVPDSLPDAGVPEPYVPDSLPDSFSQSQEQGADTVEPKGIQKPPPPDISPGGFSFNAADHVASLKNSKRDGATALTGKLGMNFDLDGDYKTEPCMFNPNPEDSTCVEWENQAKLTVFKVRCP